MHPPHPALLQMACQTVVKSSSLWPCFSQHKSLKQVTTPAGREIDRSRPRMGPGVFAFSNTGAVARGRDRRNALTAKEMRHVGLYERRRDAAHARSHVTGAAGRGTGYTLAGNAAGTWKRPPGWEVFSIVMSPHIAKSREMELSSSCSRTRVGTFRSPTGPWGCRKPAITRAKAVWEVCLLTLTGLEALCSDIRTRSAQSRTLVRYRHDFLSACTRALLFSS